jgi:hypothetical protein
MPEHTSTRPVIRDRRGRDRRGLWIVPGPHTPDGVPGERSRRERFDAVVAGVVAELEKPWRAELDGVEFGVEEVPWVDDDWQPERVPLATLVPGRSREPTRIVVYRLPIRARLLRDANTARERDLVYAALVDRIAELLGRSPDDVDPRVDTP